MQNAQLDLRGLPVWERPPLVFNAFDGLPAGGSIVLVTENEPRGLSARIEQHRRHEAVLEPHRVGEHEWHVTLRRVTHRDGDAATPHGVLLRANGFSSLDEQALVRLASASTLHTARRGQIVVGDNISWPHVGVVLEGVLALATGVGTPRSRIFYEMFAFEVFGEAELFDQSPTLGRTIVLSKTVRYLRVPREAVLKAAALEPQLLVGLGGVLAQRSRRLIASLTSQTTLPIVARVAQILMPYAVAERGLCPALSPLPNMTQAQIAAAAGTVKEVAARAIAELESRGLLKRERGHVRLLDRQGLLELVRELS